jgi:nucleoside-diphosphate-sugar epimerase
LVLSWQEGKHIGEAGSRDERAMETKKSRAVLVTGSRGFIGRAVCNLLLRGGYRVLALDQGETEDDEANPLRKEIQCDISDAAQVQRVFEAEGIDTVVHLAAVLPTAAHADPRRATQVNIQGSLNLLEMASRFGARRMVFGSSVSVYGSWPHDERVSETHRAAPDDLYGAAKIYVERLGEAYRASNRLEFVSLRMGRVVGAGGHSATSAWRSEMFERLQTATPVELSLPFVGTERILLLHVEDVARMLLLLLRAPQHSHMVYNAPCDSVTVSELKRQIESLNPTIRVNLGNLEAVGNPRRLDASRFESEFGFHAIPIFEQLKRAA